MTDLLERPEVQRRARARPAPPPPPVRAHAGESVAVALLALAAIMPFGRVFATPDWVVPLAAAAVLPVALSWVLRRLAAPWWAALALTLLGWLWYTSATLLPGTLWNGFLPTLSSLRVAFDAVLLAVQRIALLPAPVYPETPLLVLAVAGVWWVAASIDVLALRLGAPGKAIVCALTLWLVPLAIVPDGDPPWLLAAPLLLTSVIVMLAEADRDALRWGRVVTPPLRGHAVTTGAPSRHPSGIALALCAVVVGTLLAGLLPGFGDPPWYQLRAQSTTTLTDNPIVQLRTNLVAQNTGPILRVRTEEPVYLRSTALDHYSENEEWTASDAGIELLPLERGFVPGGNFTQRRREVRIQVLKLEQADLVPAPTNPVRFDPPDGVRPLYDPRTSTFVFEDAKLHSGQRYQVMTSGPDIDPEIAAALDTPAEPQFTQLPEGVPDEVGRLARRIVDEADADTPFRQALAIQNELRSWEYSLEPPAGHSGVAMRTFLENRVGYCEQFAGTMAVMLRTLGVPARVAVGFTPGTVSADDPTLWTVTWANAHAWVEVKFGGEWVAFEPTPRADGNVLVPSANDLSPDVTAQDPQITDATMAPPPGTNAAEFDIFDERDAMANRENSALPEDLPAAGGGGTVSRRITDPVVLAGVGALLLAALTLLIALGRRQAGPGASPRTRIMSVREQLGRLGHGMGVPLPPWETDREYLSRLGGDARAGTELAEACNHARYAPDVPVALAERAERAGAELTRALVGDRPAWQRALIRLRGDAMAGWRRVRGRG